ncbi:hypothetical protein ACET3Z_017231 [Daucus carota]
MASPDEVIISDGRNCQYSVINATDTISILSFHILEFALFEHLSQGFNCLNHIKLQIQLNFICSGPAEDGWVAKGFDNESAYSIMFGLDKCRVTNKIFGLLEKQHAGFGHLCACSLSLTTLQQVPFFLAAKFLKVKLPHDAETSRCLEFDVHPLQLEGVSNQMLELNEQNKVPHSQTSEVEGSAVSVPTHQEPQLKRVL